MTSTFKKSLATNSLHYLIVLCLIALSFFYFYYTMHKSFDYDEYEQVHYVFYLQHGQAFYKNVQNTHGPLFPIMNTIIWNVLKVPNSIEAILLFRFINLFYALCLVWITTKFSKLLFPDTPQLLSALFLVSCTPFLYKCIEFRPDVLQNLFWLTGFYFFLKHLLKKTAPSLLTPIVWSLATLINLKALLPIALSGSLALYFFHGRRTALKNILNTLAYFGLILLGLFSVGHYLDIRQEYFFCQIYIITRFIHNLDLSFLGAVRGNSITFFTENIFFICAFLAGVFSIIKTLKTQTPYVYYLGTTLCLIASAPLFGWWYQWYLIFLPLCATIAAYGCQVLAKNYSVQKKSIQLMLLSLVCIALLFSLHTFTQIALRLKEPAYNNKTQIQRHKQLTALLTPNHAVFYYWGAWENGDPYGLYMFQPNVFYYWTLVSNAAETLSKIAGYNLMDVFIVRRIQHSACEAIIITPADLKTLPRDTQIFITNNYRRLPKSNFWIKMISR
jgi:hypothetical protein